MDWLSTRLEKVPTTRRLDNRAVSATVLLRTSFDPALTEIGVKDAVSVRYTFHDFRLFITDAVRLRGPDKDGARAAQGCASWTRTV